MWAGFWLNLILIRFVNMNPEAIFTKGLSLFLGLTFVYKCHQPKPEIRLRPFVNTAPD